MKTFASELKLRGFITNRFALQEMLLEGFQTEMKRCWTLTQSCVKRSRSP